jgi:hypothetical protein
VTKMIDPGPSTRGWHHLQDVLTCPERYRLRAHVQRWEDEPEKPAFAKGELLHLGLAHYYMYKKYRDADRRGFLEDWLGPQEAMKRKAKAEGWEKYLPLVSRALKLYHEEYGRDTHWEVVHVERELKVRVGKDATNPKGHLYTQRADLIVRDRDTGLIWIVDHKTTSKITARTANSFVLNGQFIGYRMLGQAFFGEKFGGVKLNLIQLKEDDYDFKRPRLPPSPNTADRFKTTILFGETMIATMTALYGTDKPWPQAFATDTCIGRYGTCPMHDICQWGEP